MSENGEDAQEKQTISVKERTQKFNRMASIEDELSSSPRQQKEKKKTDKVSFDLKLLETTLVALRLQTWGITIG